MNWFTIIKDISLVAVGGVVSTVSMLFFQWFNERRKRNNVAKLIVKDIGLQRDRLWSLAHLIETHPAPESFDFGEARYDIKCYDPTIFKALIGKLAILPPECLEKVLSFYQMLAIFDEKLRGVSKERNQKRLKSAFHGAERVFALALEAEASIEEKVFHNVGIAKGKIKEAQKLRNEYGKETNSV